MAIEAFDGVRRASSDNDRSSRRGSSMRAMPAGDTWFENATKDLTGLPEGPLPAGQGRHRASIEGPASPVAGQRPAVLDHERLVIAIDALRGFRHVAARGYDRSDEDRAAVAVLKADRHVSEIGPALARFRAAIDPA